MPPPADPISHARRAARVGRELIAAGAPVLYVLLHELRERGDHHHHDLSAALAWDHPPAGTDDPASDVHPHALQDDARLIKRDIMLFPSLGQPGSSAYC